jgi:hypothetical protein
MYIRYIRCMYFFYLYSYRNSRCNNLREVNSQGPYYCAVQTTMSLYKITYFSQGFAGCRWPQGIRRLGLRPLVC